MTVYISYFEVGLVDETLVTRLGSGCIEEIIELSRTDASIRACLSEPSEPPVRFRARCGVAEMTPDGPVPIWQDDPTQDRGAWIRMLPVGLRVWAALQLAYGDGDMDPAISRGLITGWLEVDGSVVKATDLLTARNAMTEASAATYPEERVFVRLCGTADQIKLALALLRNEDLTAADEMT